MKLQPVKHVLSSGLRVLMIPNPDSVATNVLVLTKTGSESETKDINGISHFMEHLAFKGTKRRPSASRIATDLDALGASYNAYTSQEYTGYYATVVPNKVTAALDILADMYLYSTFPEAEIEKERGVIIEEINMYEDLPMRRVGEDFLALLYGDQPAGWSIAGRKEVVQSLTRQNFLDYRKNNYVAPATVIVAAGNFNEKRFLKQVSDQFATLSPEPQVTRLEFKEAQLAPAFSFKSKASDQTHLVLGFRALPLGDSRHYRLEVLTTILGGGMSSRLFRRIRDDLGAAYYVRAINEAYTRHGALAIAVGADNKRVTEITKVILEECDLLRRRLVGPAELARAKDLMVGNLMLDLEKSSAIAGFYGFNELLENQLKSPAAIARKIKSVTASELRELAQEIFVNSRLNLALIGPEVKSDLFAKILNLQ